MIGIVYKSCEWLAIWAGRARLDRCKLLPTAASGIQASYPFHRSYHA
jgi:hypothetical protein